MRILCLLLLSFFAAAAQARDHFSIAPLPAPLAVSPGRAKVTAQLEDRMVAIRKEAQECARQGRGDAEFTSRAATLLDTHTVFSVEVFGSSMCPGAAHPNSWQYGLTYDMTTGRRYNPLALYRIATRENGGRVKLAPAAEKLVQAQLLTRAGPECRTAVIEQLPETGLSYGLSLTGFNLYFDAPHVVQSCFHPVSLPYGRIRAFLNPREAARLHWRL